jgi:YVTN family beta-propeller protein
MPIKLFALCILALATVASADHVRVLVTNERSGDVTVIDAESQQVVRTIRVGTRPRGIRVSLDNKRAFVAVSATPISGPPGSRPATTAAATQSTTQAKATQPAGKDGIVVIDLQQMKVTQTLVSGRDPENLALSTDTSKIYVSNEDTSEASIIDVAANKRAKVFKVGDEPEGVAISPDGRQVLVTCETTSNVYVIDTAAEEIASHFSTAARPRSAVFTADGSKAYVTCETGAAICIVDPVASRISKTIKPPGDNVRPMGICISGDSKYVYATTGRGGSVIRINTADDALDKIVEHVGPRPWGIGITPNRKLLFTANGPSNDVSVIDGETFEVIKRIPAGNSPWGVAIVTIRD